MNDEELEVRAVVRKDKHAGAVGLLSLLELPQQRSQRLVEL